VLFCALCVIWGIPYLLIKVAVRDFSPATLVFGRTAIGALLLAPLAVRNGGLRVLLPRWRALIVYTVVELAIPWFFLSSAERRLSSSLSGLLVASVPLIGAVLALAGFADDRLDWRRTAGLLIGLGGVVAVLGLDIKTSDLGSVGEVGLVAVGYALGPQIIARQLAGLPGLSVAAGSLGLAALGYAGPAMAELPRHWPGAGPVASVVTLGVVCTALAFVLFFGLIAEAGPVRATVITYFNPAVAVALGAAVLGEPFTVGTALGFVLIIAGSALATRRPAQSRMAQVVAAPEAPSQL
jgi:drug/metabolite transporter (DMT)-like permease